MEFRSIGLFRSLEIHGLSPGLNIVFGPTGSGKTTLRRAIGGMFYGFERSGTDSLLPNKGINSLAEAEVEFQGADYRLSRRENHWDKVIDLVRNSQSGAPRISITNGLGGLSSSDYFTFFNVSLIDSPEIHRRMVHALSHSPALTGGSSYWNSESDYLSWRKLAEQRRADLAALQRDLSDAIAEKDRIAAQLHSSKESFGLRLKELEDRIALLSSQRVDLKHRRATIQDELNQKEVQIELLRQKIQDAPSRQVIRKPVVISDRLVQLYKMLDDVQARIGRVRSVQKDLTNRRMEIREARTETTDSPSRIAELEMKTVRKTITQLEDKIDDLNHALKEAAILDHHDRSVLERYKGDRHLEQKAKETLAQAKDDLYNLCQDLSQHQRHLARGRMNAENRDLRRCWNELKRQLAWLKIRRKAILDEIRILDASGYELIVRGRRPFCNCARHHGHLEARRKFLEEKSEEVIVQPGVDTSAWEAELRDLLASVSELKVHLMDVDRQITDVTDIEAVKRRSAGCHVVGTDHRAFGTDLFWAKPCSRTPGGADIHRHAQNSHIQPLKRGRLRQPHEGVGPGEPSKIIAADGLIEIGHRPVILQPRRQRMLIATCAPAIAVAPVVSKGGETSTTSPPRILIPRSSLRIASACAEVRPPQTGVPVPGAYAGSRQSISKVR